MYILYNFINQAHLLALVKMPPESFQGWIMIQRLIGVLGLFYQMIATGIVSFFGCIINNSSTVAKYDYVYIMAQPWT